MKDERKRNYLGLPGNLKITVFWVTRPERTRKPVNLKINCDLIVEYRNGIVLGFDWINSESHYLMRILQEQFYKNKATFDKCSKNQKLNVIKNKVTSIYYRVYRETENKDIPFSKIWDGDKHNKLPWEILERKKEFINFSKYLDLVFSKKIVDECKIINNDLFFKYQPIEKYQLN